MAENEVELLKLENEKNEAQKDLSKKTEDFDNLTDEISMLKDEHREAEKLAESKLNQNIIELEKVKGYLKMKENELAIYLEEKVKNDQKYEMEIENIKISKKEEIRKLTMHLENFQTECKDLEKVKNELIVREKELELHLNEKQKNVEKYITEITSYKASKEKEIEVLMLDLEKLRKEIKDLEKLKSDLILKVKELELHLNEKHKSEERFKAEITSFKASKDKEIDKLTLDKDKLMKEIKELEKFKGAFSLKEKELELNNSERVKSEKKLEAELESIKVSKADDIMKISSKLEAVKQEKESNFNEIITRNEKIRDLENELKTERQINLITKESTDSKISKISEDFKKLTKLSDQNLKEKQELYLKINELKTQLQERDKAKSVLDNANSSRIKEIEQLKVDLAIKKTNNENASKEINKKDIEIRDLKTKIEDQQSTNRNNELKWKAEKDKLKTEIAKLPQNFIMKPISEGNAGLIDKLKADGVVKSSIVEYVMKHTDRMLYCRTENSYIDKPQSIGYSVSISAPHMHAHALENLLDHLAKPDCRVLDVGSGLGYLTMCFARIVISQSVTSTGFVVGIDNNPRLIELSTEYLNSDDPKFLSVGKIKIVKGDGRLGYSQYAPYDVIHVGAAAEEVPDKLLEQLKLGGRMIVPVGPSGEQQFIQFDKSLEGEIKKKTLLRVSYRPLTDHP